jgi:glycosyltransferase involved in cell wall biosynthesis
MPLRPCKADRAGKMSLRMNSARISAIVCTYRRPALLAKTLESLAAQTLPKTAYEVIVVDNGGDAATAELLRRWADVPPFRCVREPVPGLSSARNRGVALAGAPYVAFIDDDAVAAPSWLEAIVRAFTEVAPRPACVGGKIEPAFAIPRPGWFPDELLGFLSVVDWSPHAGPLSGQQWLAGTNIAFAQDELRALGGFSTQLSRRGEELLGMEEVVLQRRLRQLGRPLYYDPAIVVRHHVAAERLTRRWLHRRAFFQGISDALADRQQTAGLPRAAIFAAKAGLIALHPWAFAAAALPLPPTPRGLVRECAALSRAGYVAATLGRARGRTL